MICRVLAAGIAAWLVLGTAQAAPLEAYGQLPTLDHFAIAPDGKHIAYVTNVQAKRTVLINDLAAAQPVAAIALIDDQKLRDLTWGDGDHLMMTLSITRKAVGVTGGHNEQYMTQVYSLTEKASYLLLAHGDYQMNIVLGIPDVRNVQGHTVAFIRGVTFVNQQGVAALFQEDLGTGRRNSIVEMGSSKHSTEWFLDGDGNIIARTEYDDDAKVWTLQIKHGAGYTTAFQTAAPIDTPWVFGITPDGKSIVVLSPENGQTITRQFSLATDKPEKGPELGDDGYVTPINDPVTHRLIGFSRLDQNTSYHFFNDADQSAWDGLARAFPGENVDLVSWSADRKMVVVQVDGKRDGSSYFLIDLNTHKASFLGPVYQGIEPTDVAEVKYITYTAADGTRIPAYLTLPNGKDPKNLPLVMLPHGGPAARDTPEFDWISQALASRGYAVLQPEFRGSDGYGWAHLSAGFGQWGRKMQSDLADGLRYLAQQGIVDAKRVCIVGASYGGYAAMAGATLDKSLYRCAVADAGVSDLRNMLAWTRDRYRDSDSLALRYWERFMGAENRDDPKLDEVSPLRHVNDNSIPLLLIHGKDDTVVPIDQSETLEAAMRAAGKPVTLVKLESEDHWLSRGETRERMLAETVKFLEANNPP